eukprot:Clim_evm86s156 gene=Clim_evmTU86s156
MTHIWEKAGKGSGQCGVCMKSMLMRSTLKCSLCRLKCHKECNECAPKCAAASMDEIEAMGHTSTIPSAIPIEPSRPDAWIVEVRDCPPLSGGRAELQVTSNEVVIWTMQGQRVTGFPLEFIRKFGADETDFTLEAGRRCETGEGVFQFATGKAAEIDAKVKSQISILMEALKAKRMGRQPSMREETNRNCGNVGTVALGASTSRVPLVDMSSAVTADEEYEYSDFSRGTTPRIERAAASSAAAAAAEDELDYTDFGSPSPTKVSQSGSNRASAMSQDTQDEDECEYSDFDGSPQRMRL